ncbi:EXLDI protein [Microlunatus speluncae]|uniref:EXLDI protein n=1 Tax=Microlunatus speluncae TaxID=2594267 RepID=UPI0012663238|nr:EXLDI protein [Microlunatus speluncae]
MPNKTIYVSDSDQELFAKAQELAGGSLSAAITTALRQYVELEEGRQEGFEEIVVKVGVGVGRKVRFSGVLLAEWANTTMSRMETYRIYRSRTGKFVLHVDRSPEWKDQSDNAEKWSQGWRAWVGNLSANQSWSYTQGEATLDVVDHVEDLKDKVPPKLYELIKNADQEPLVEDLDI